MSKTDRDDRQLDTLERWKRLELESAQAEHLACQAAEREKRDERERVLSVIENAQDFARRKCDSGAVLSPADLLAALQFSQVQQRALVAADQALQDSQAAVEKAQLEVTSRAEHLFGIEKLRERRQLQRTKDEALAEQKQLDESGLLKLSSENVVAR